MPTIDNTTVIREGKQDGYVSEAQVYHMIRKYSDAYRYLQFDLCEVKKVHTSVPDGELYGAIQGRLVITENNKTLENRWIQPFSLRDFELPSENEYVLVFEYGFPPNAKLYYIRDFSIDRKLNYNISNFGKSGLPLEAEVRRAADVVNKKVHKIVPLPRYKDGDKFIHGRFGQTIQFTSKNKQDPCLRISNNTNKFNEEGLYVPYFDNEGSVIYLEGSIIPLDLKQRVGGVDKFPELTGDQIVIESDRLIFQSKKEEIFINSFKKVSINSPEILINGQPYVHGNLIKDIVDQLVSILGKFSTGQVGTVSGGVVVGTSLAKETAILKSIRKQIFSSKNLESKTNPLGKPSKEKSDEELTNYLITSGY